MSKHSMRRGAWGRSSALLQLVEGPGPAVVVALTLQPVAGEDSSGRSG